MWFKSFSTVCVALIGFVATIEGSDDQKQQVRILTLGHVDHGMESVTTAILKRQASRQLAQTSSIAELVKPRPSADFSKSFKIMRAEVTYETNKRKYSHVQCQHHADYIKELIAGAKRFDGAILVVSAADGPMPQTREHIGLARKVGIPALVVFLDKCNLVDDKELLELVELETRELLTKYGYPGDDVPFVRGSSYLANDNPDDAEKMKCIDDLLTAVDKHIPVSRPEDSPLSSSGLKKCEAYIYHLSVDDGGRKTALVSGYQGSFRISETSGVTGRLSSVSTDECAPGDATEVSIDLDSPVSLQRGLRFTVQEENRTIAVGVVTGLGGTGK